METSVVFPEARDVEEMRGTAKIRPFSVFNSRTSRGRDLLAVVAAGRNGEIGVGGDMPWHIPEDLKHFKETTMGRAIIMGRSTWESLPRRPLPGRRNIVLTRNAAYQAPGAETYGSFEAALASCEPSERPVVIGGGKVYAEALPYLTEICVTRVDAEFSGADTYFPALPSEEWQLFEEGEWQLSKSGHRFRIETLKRTK